MNLEVTSYLDKVKELLKNVTSIRLAEAHDEESVHQILESVSMKLQDGLELVLSRRPSLSSSYDEVLMKPIIFVDQQAKSATATISETAFYRFGKRALGFYSSDLRMSENTPLSVKKEFATFYPELVASAPSTSLFLTTVLKDNLRAMKLFSKLSKNLHYNPYIELLTRTLVILPTAKTTVPKIMISKASQHTKELENYLENKMKEAEFSPDLPNLRKRHDPGLEFILMGENKKIVGYFSLYRPKSKNLIAKVGNRRIKLLLFLIKFLTRNDLTKKVPWSYLNHLILDDPKHLKDVLSHLFRLKILKAGELLSFTHLKNQVFEGDHDKWFMGLPQIETESIVFKVETKENPHSLLTHALMDPTIL